MPLMQFFCYCFQLLLLLLLLAILQCSLYYPAIDYADFLFSELGNECSFVKTVCSIRVFARSPAVQ